MIYKYDKVSEKKQKMVFNTKSQKEKRRWED